MSFHAAASLVIVALLTTGCASGLVAAQSAVTRTLTITTASANAYCDAPPAGPEKARRCVEFNRDLVPIIETAEAFNLAVQEGSAAEVPSMASALIRLRDIVWLLLPEGTRDLLKQRIEGVYAQIQRGTR